MNLNKELIRQLRNGEIAVENNGTLEQLKEVVKAAFPGTPHPSGSYKFYQKDTDDERVVWDCFYKTNLPIISVSGFYQPEQFTGWAKDDNLPKWMVYFKNDVAKFGFDTLNDWADTNVHCGSYSGDEDNRPATHEEISIYLISEAIKRGYKKGVTCLFGKDTRDVKTSNIEYVKTTEGYGCLVMGINTIFSEKDGQWAKIVEHPAQVKTKSNPIHYTVDGMEYSFNYKELKAKYEDICQYSDEQFMEELPEIAHLACIVCYVKGLGNNATIGDKGIVHELIHLMAEPNEPTNNLQDIRKSFNDKIKLA